MIFTQIFDMVDIGIVILDRDLMVTHWNRWMATHSGIPADEIVHQSIFDHYPDLDTPSFKRNYKSVFKFGNFAFFSQKLHGYLFPFKVARTLDSDFKYMQQSCTMGPLRDEHNRITNFYIMVQNVTEIVAYEEKLIEMNIRDGLTDLYNRRYMESRLADEFERHQRYREPFSLIMLDIDNFKKINDEYGHQAGDVVLKNFADLILATVRKVDIVARYGGEEFCCLLPETTLKEGILLAERIRKQTERYRFTPKGNDLKVTTSLGVAELCDGISTAEDLIHQADAALYRAKANGRNKTVSMSPLEASPALTPTLPPDHPQPQ